MADTCEHLDEAADVTPASKGCAACLELGDQWVKLRMCMVCGNVGCCDNSKNRHARGHWNEVGHPLIQSFQPGEDWWYCYPEDLGFTMPERPSYSFAD